MTKNMDSESNSSESRDKFAQHPTKTRGGPIKINDVSYQDSPDGGWGWVVVLAVWIDNMCVLGMLKSSLRKKERILFQSIISRPTYHHTQSDNILQWSNSSPITKWGSIVTIGL